MTTRAEFLAGLRIRLKDLGGANPRWPDDELLAYLGDAVKDYSKYFPRRREESFLTDGEAQRYPAPSDLLDDRITAVVLVDSQGRERLLYPRSLTPRGTRWYEVIGDEIIFGWVPATGLTIRVRYDALHTFPEDPTKHSSVPEEDEDLVYVCAMAIAWQRLAGNDAALSRWKEQGKRDDGPIIPHHRDLWARYRRMIEQKKAAPRTMRRVRNPGTWRRRWMV